MVTKFKKNGRATKPYALLLASLLVTLSLTLGLELVVIGPLLKSERPLIVQFSQNQINLSPGEAREVSVSVSSDFNVTSIRIFVSNQTVISASWLTPGREVEVLALANGQSQLLILGPGYGISYVPLASLNVTVGE
jgi:hypothetical protein